MSQQQPITLYDTMERDLRPVEPMDGETFRFYCCGPTVYGPSHVGNFRTFVIQDTFRRVLELNGMATRHVRNITDVDDKTIRRSVEEGKTLAEITDHWNGIFQRDARALNLLEPHVEPSAVAHIPQQIRLIEKLLEQGNAYQAEDGSVYFRVSSFAGYGRLSRLQTRDLQLGSAQTAHDSDEYDKESLADFALWKSRRPEDGDNFWDSPFGEGRPGWHLECSAMGIQYLGEGFDLHSGGVDLTFPHHENEIAQSECCTGKKFARLWFHIAHLMVDGGKMSKSLGNLYTLDDLEKRGFTPAELRYVYLSGHYRKPLNFTFDSLTAAKQALARLAKAEQALANRAATDAPLGFDALKGLPEHGALASAYTALCNDLNTPEALGRMFGALKVLSPESLSPEEARREWYAFHFLLQAFGLVLPAVAAEPKSAAVPETVVALAEKRWAAKQAKDWPAADTLREEIAAAGWVIKDGKESYSLEPEGSAS